MFKVNKNDTSDFVFVKTRVYSWIVIDGWHFGQKSKSFSFINWTLYKVTVYSTFS